MKTKIREGQEHLLSFVSPSLIVDSVKMQILLYFCTVYLVCSVLKFSGSPLELSSLSGALLDAGEGGRSWLGRLEKIK